MDFADINRKKQAMEKAITETIKREIEKFQETVGEGITVISIDCAFLDTTRFESSRPERMFHWAYSELNFDLDVLEAKATKKEEE